MSAVRAWARDLGIGARFALAGGSSGWARTTLTAVGVGLGVVVLLLAASIPSALEARSQRVDARQPLWDMDDTGPGPDSFLAAGAATEYHGEGIDGLVLQPEAATATPPPGLDAFPGPGEMVVSPALAELLDSADGRLLAERLDHERVGIIGDEGLDGPGDLYYYLGSDSLADEAPRALGFGNPVFREPLTPAMALLVLVICVGLLMPVAVFMGTAARFGGERRDRRLAALRLVGADMAMTRRIAAGESLTGSLLGLLVGTPLFLAVRQHLGTLRAADLSAYPEDLSPGVGLILIVLVSVPASALMVTLFALRGVTVEPLGVVRHAEGTPRRFGWRAVPLLLGLLLLVPLTFRFVGAGDGTLTQVGVGIVLLLTGATVVLPWLVERLVGALRGGPLSWQLATRRLQLSSGPATRAVSGITVAVAAATALYMFFAGVRTANTVETGQDTSRAQVQVSASGIKGAESVRFVGGLESLPGVESARAVVTGTASSPNRQDAEGHPLTSPVTVGDCAALRELAEVAGCVDGDVFSIAGGGEAAFQPGERVLLDLSVGEPSVEPEPAAAQWTVPETITEVPAHPDPVGVVYTGILATPAALDTELLGHASTDVLLSLDPADRDAVERVRNAVWGTPGDPSVMELQDERTDRTMARIQLGLLIGATGVLVLIGASMIVTTVEQLRERRRLLSALVAVGTRRRTLSASLLWQTAIPVVLGLALAAAVGTGLGALLMGMVNLPVGDWLAFLPMAAVGGGVIVLVTLVSLPSLWYVMRPEGLRTE
ncbi:ABC transporter permease [Streptomyces sp. 8K308]|uniref:ABC transporter permease n=1 Tax=Streptomyces sp. 8K308 TaxID=2530388 RepID=UPI00104F9DD1|nr:ABC transporter permease [Streptomyces sp. 8K308]TDC26115.1 ABC transporter permease [Streptomyces sp. 8K308]